MTYSVPWFQNTEHLLTDGVRNEHHSACFEFRIPRLGIMFCTQPQVQGDWLVNNHKDTSLKSTLQQNAWTRSHFRRSVSVLQAAFREADFWPLWDCLHEVCTANLEAENMLICLLVTKLFRIHETFWHLLCLWQNSSAFLKTSAQQQRIPNSMSSTSTPLQFFFFFFFHQGTK